MRTGNKILVFTALVAAGACGTDSGAIEEGQAEVAEATSKIGEATEDRWSETRTFFQQATGELEEIGREIEESGDQVGDGVRARWSDVERNAEEARAELGESLEKARRASTEETEELSIEIEQQRLTLERWTAEARYSAIKTRDEFQQTLAADLGQIGSSVGELEVKMSDGMSDLHRETAEELDEVKKEWALLDARLTELSAKADDEFAGIRTDFARETAELEHELKVLWSKVRT